MPVINALVELGQLRCDREGDGNDHSEPYIWPVLFQVDDDTLTNPPGSPVLVSMTSAPSAPFRVVVKSDMRPARPPASRLG